MLIFPGQGRWLAIQDEIEEGKHPEVKKEIARLYVEADGLKKAALYVRDYFDIGAMDAKKLVYYTMEDGT